MDPIDDRELARLLDREPARVDADVRDAIDRGPIDPALALSPDELDRMLERDSGLCETGWCNMGDGSGYAAVRTPMPGVTGEMLDWWFSWHPHDPLRYRIWFPGAHADISIDPHTAPARKDYWGTVHHPVEDIGLGMQRLRIHFVDPLAFGFSEPVVRDPSVATIVCGIVGDERRHAWHTRLCHFASATDDGIELRSRFWIGSALGLFSEAPPATAINHVLRLPAVRRRLVPRRASSAMARHCAAEYANLRAILPELFSEYA